MKKNVLSFIQIMILLSLISCDSTGKKDTDETAAVSEFGKIITEKQYLTQYESGEHKKNEMVETHKSYYNHVGQLVKSEIYGYDELLEYLHEYLYDEAGNLIKHTYHASCPIARSVGKSDLKQGFITVFIYDDQNRLIKEEHESSFSGAEETKEYFYDSSGVLEKEINMFMDEYKIVYEYPENNKKRAIEYDFENNIRRTHLYVYDERDNLVEELEWNSLGEETRRTLSIFDQHNNITKQEIYLFNDLINTLHYEYEYDTQGNRVFCLSYTSYPWSDEASMFFITEWEYEEFEK